MSADVIWVINITINSSAGFAPHRLMFGFDQSKHGSLDVQNRTANREKDQSEAKARMDKSA